MTNDEARFPRTTLRRGYDVNEVDAFCRRLEEELQQRRAGRQLSTGLTSADVHNIQFSSERGGYQEGAVDDYLEKVRIELDQLARSANASAAEQSGPDSEGTRADRPSNAAADRELWQLLALSRRPSGERFGRTARLAIGYRPEEVDQFVDRVASTVRSALTSREVRNVEFANTRGGYDEEEVDLWLDRIEEHTHRQGR